MFSLNTDSDLEVKNAFWLKKKKVKKAFSKVWDWLNANKRLMLRSHSLSSFTQKDEDQKDQKVNHQVEIKLTDNNINSSTYFEKKEYGKYLGILIDNHLTWKPHIDYVTTKISKTIGVIARLRHQSIIKLK